MKHFALIVLVLSSLLACDSRDIRQVVKDMAESPVDTSGFVSKTIRTNVFSAVEIDCFADITFHQTKENVLPYVRLRTQADVLKHVRVRTSEGILFLSTDRRYRMPDNAVVVADVYAPFVSAFTLNGGKCLRLGTLRLKSPLKLELYGRVGALTADTLVAHEVNLYLDGDCSADLRGIDAEYMNVELPNNGHACLSGRVGSMDSTVPGTGKLDISGLKILAGKSGNAK